MQTEYAEAAPVTQNYNDLFIEAAAPSASLRVSVIVPARNEAKIIRKALDALRLQADNNGLPLKQGIYEVLLLVNNCSDQTFSIVKQYQKKFPQFPFHVAEALLAPANANIGFVRRILMDEACRRLDSIGNQAGIIASTDSDTQVDKCWVYHIIQEMANGCDAVGGRILTHSQKSCARMYHLRDVAYRSLLARAEAIIDPDKYDPWPRHFQYFGASMAVTCAAYRLVGRLPQVPYLEDNAFHQALQRMDMRIRKTPAVKAYTSTRMSGRVKIGFSEQLKKWSGYIKNGFQQEVEPVEAWLIKFRCRRILRDCREQYLNDGFYDYQALEVVAENLMIDVKWLCQELVSTSHFGLLWEKVRHEFASGNWVQRWDLVPITDAIQELRAFCN